MQDPTLDAGARARLRSIGRAIRTARGEMTQTELGELLGAPQTTVSRWERGTVDYGVEQLRAIEVALRLPLGSLLISGGYVLGDELPEPILRVTRFLNLESAMSVLDAAEELGLGVRLTNRWEPDDSGDGHVLTWTLVSSAEAPGEDD